MNDNNTFSEKLTEFFTDFKNARKMVLSTSCNNIVSSRMMSVVQENGKLYFQTDVTMRKFNQLSENPNVALCIDNIQIEGTAKIQGRPSDNLRFCELFEKCYKGSFDAYSHLENERVFEVEPKLIERWIYKDGVPFIETFDLESRSYTISQYCGK